MGVGGWELKKTMVALSVTNTQPKHLSINVTVTYTTHIIKLLTKLLYSRNSFHSLGSTKYSPISIPLVDCVEFEEHIIDPTC